jgi:hypothetical protein
VDLNIGKELAALQRVTMVQLPQRQQVSAGRGGRKEAASAGCALRVQ